MSFAKNGAILTDYTTGYVDVTNQLDEGSSGTTKDIVLITTDWAVLNYAQHHGKVVQLQPASAGTQVHIALPTPVVGMKVKVRAGIKLTNATAAFQVHAAWTNGTTGLTAATGSSTAKCFGATAGASSVPDLGSSTALKSSIKVAACEPYHDCLEFEAVTSSLWIVTGNSKVAVTSVA